MFAVKDRGGVGVIGDNAFHAGVLRGAWCTSTMFCRFFFFNNSLQSTPGSGFLATALNICLFLLTFY